MENRLSVIQVILSILLSNTLAHAQPQVKALTIGDRIPEELWNLPLQVVNNVHGQGIARLGDYRSRLIILDFWATWCDPCIKNFPKLRGLQADFGDSISVLAVTRENIGKILPFFETGKGKEHSDITSVVNDSILSQYFPHRGIPHVVWISSDGNVFSITRAEDLTSNNIQAVLRNEEPVLRPKIDIDQNRPLFLSEKLDNLDSLISFSIFLNDHIPGLPSGVKYRKTNDDMIYSAQFTNLPIMDIYLPIVFRLFEKGGEMFNLKRAMIEVREPEKLRFIRKSGGGYERDNLYCYELTVPAGSAESLFSNMLADLNRYSDYYVSIERVLADCLLLVRTSKIDKIKSKGGTPKDTFPASPSTLRNLPLSNMVNMLNGNTPVLLPVIDETGYFGPVDIEVSGVESFETLRLELNKYDLDLQPAQKMLNMFIVREK